MSEAASTLARTRRAVVEQMAQASQRPHRWEAAGWVASVLVTAARTPRLRSLLLATLAGAGSREMPIPRAALLADPRWRKLHAN
jgi:hypothetical protein